jgi:hypothetical protein
MLKFINILMYFSPLSLGSVHRLNPAVIKLLNFLALYVSQVVLVVNGDLLVSLLNLVNNILIKILSIVVSLLLHNQRFSSSTVRVKAE